MEDVHLRRIFVVAGLGLASALYPSTAGAHIILVPDGGAETPRDWLVMADPYGDPQKPTPCGGTGTPTNIVTTLRTGQSVTLSWVEAIAHSGHFRIAFAPVSPAAATATTLPDPTVVTYTDSTNTEASAVAVTATGGSISANGTVLADNLFPHCIKGDPCPSGAPVVTAPKTYSATVTLPSTPCTNCTLQLVQFMSYHPVDPSFFYHHCAAVTLVAPPSGEGGPHAGDAAGVRETTDASASSGAGSAEVGMPDALGGGGTHSGSGCSVAGQESVVDCEWLAGLLVALRWRRRSRRRVDRGS